MVAMQSKSYIGILISICFSITCISLGWCFAISNRVTATENKCEFLKETLNDIKKYQEESTKEIKDINKTLSFLIANYEIKNKKKEQ